MAKKYLLTPQADFDLEEIFIYTAKQWGINQAEKYLHELGEIMQDIADGRLPGKDCGILLKDITTNLLYYHANNHYIFYRLHKKGIEVLALYNDRMDLPYHIERLNNLM